MDPQAKARQSTLPSSAAGPLATLRRAWTEATVAAAPGVDGLDDLLGHRLEALDEAGRLDEGSLLAVAEDGAQLALEAGSAETARELSKRLRRAIYEYLLAEDAVVEAAKEAPHRHAAEVTLRDGVMLIGVEEVEAVAAARSLAESQVASVIDGAGADDVVTAEAMRSALESDDGEWAAATDEVELWAGAATGVAEQIEDHSGPAPAIGEIEEAVDVEEPTGDLGEALAIVEEAYEVAHAAEEADAETLAAMEDALTAVESALVETPEPAPLDPDAALVPVEFRRDEAPAPPPDAPPEEVLAPVPTPEPELEIAPAPVPTPEPELEIAPAPEPELAVAPTSEPAVESEAVADAVAAPAAAPAVVARAAKKAATPPPAEEDLIGVPAVPLPFELASDSSTAPPFVAPETPPIAMVPRDEFHISDASMYLPKSPPEETPESSPEEAGFGRYPAASAERSEWQQRFAEPEADDGQRPPGWNVRFSPRQQLLAERMAAKRREDAVRTALEAAAQAAAASGNDRRSRRRGGDAEPLGSFEEVHAKLEDHLNRKRGAEVGALLQRAAQELGGRHIADLAMDAGDRCMSVGQTRAATNCFLAAWRADPIYEAPLWRLADVCLSDREVSLAVGYLERVAALMRARGDDDGALNVYRKIVTIAPERRDIRDVIRLAQTTGRLEP
ncbi:MAG TPA: hypothetical protein VG266_12700 [Candidatus Dormibacteraeota bacterium]|nr:hypothetical protein [Candidatus Dormibacteraeota bacterium]